MTTIDQISNLGAATSNREIREWIAKMHLQGIRLWAEGTSLKFESCRPLPDDIRLELGVRKQEVLDYLRAAGGDVILSCPASFAQSRLWLLEQFSPGLLAYHVPIAIRLTGTVDKVSLETAVGDVIRRHEILRTTFTEEHGVPRQVIHRSARVDWREFTDLRVDELEQRIRHCLQEPFDLAHGPLCRAWLFSFATGEHVCLLIMHHIVCDAWSMETLSRDLLEFYRARVEKTVPKALELRFQYADYSLWQHSRTATAGYQQQLAYWKRKLSGDLIPVEMPGDLPRPPVKTYRGKWHRFEIDSAVFSRLQDLCQRENLTAFTLLLAAFRVFLHRHSGQKDFVIGTPVAGRQNKDVEPLIGFFVNTLPLRTALDDANSFLDVARNEKQTVLEAISNQDVPFEVLVEELVHVRDAGRTPLVQVMFTYYKDDLMPRRVGLATVSPVPVDLDSAKFDLMLSFNETVDGLKATLEYSTDLFTSATAARLADRMATLLSSIAAEPTGAIARLALLPPAEKSELLRWSQGVTLMPSTDHTVSGRFQAMATRYPGAIAVTIGTRNINYRELDQRSSVLAEEILHRGLQPGEIVGILMEKSIEAIIAMLAIIKAGGAYLPLDPTYPEDRLTFMVNDCRSRLVVAAPGQRFAAGGVTFIEYSTTSSIAEGRRPLPHANPEDLAYVIYTSGSTGRPKGVGVEHRNVTQFLDSCAYHYETKPSDVWSAFHSLSFDYSIWEIWGPLLCGGRTVLITRDEVLEAGETQEILRREKVTILSQTPAAFSVLSEQLLEGPRLENLRLIMLSGEALTYAQLRDWVGIYGVEQPRIYNIYGITETTVFVTIHRVSKEAVFSDVGSNIGRPMNGYQTYIVDRNNEPCAVGVPGEIQVGGIGVARGYLNRDELNRTRFVENQHIVGNGLLYRSGDLGRWNPDGTIEYLGRIDHQIKIRGFRVEIGEVEAAIRNATQSQDVIVVARTERGTTVMHAYWVGEIGAEKLVRDELIRRLPKHMVPTYLSALRSFPLTANGKVDRRALPVRAARDSSILAQPETELERAIAAIWKEVLPTQHFGIDDDFFELGGQSLMLMRVRARLEKVLSRDVPAVQFVQYPTIRSFAQFASAVRSQGTGTHANPVRNAPIGVTSKND